MTIKIPGWVLLLLSILLMLMGPLSAPALSSLGITTEKASLTIATTMFILGLAIGCVGIESFNIKSEK